MDENYIKFNGKWVYLNRAVDKEGNTIDFLLRAKSEAIAAKTFLRKAFKGAHDYFNKDALKEEQIEIRQVKYLNNIVEQDH